MADKYDRDRKCKYYECASCIIPCRSCVVVCCNQCRFGYKNIVGKLKEAYSMEYLEENKDRCIYAKFACEEE